MIASSSRINFLLYDLLFPMKKAARKQLKGQKIKDLSPKWDSLALVDNYRKECRRKNRTVPPGVRHDVLARDDFTCQHCGKKAPEFPLEIDHKISRDDGGTNHPSNLQALCKDCNIGKSNKKVDKYYNNKRWNVWGNRCTLIKENYLMLDDEAYLIPLRDISSINDLIWWVSHFSGKAPDTCYGNVLTATYFLTKAFEDIYLNNSAEFYR